MSHHYVVRSKVDKTCSEEKIRYYAVPVTTGQITTEKLAEYISDRCSLTAGDVLAAVSALSELIREQLDCGYTVNLHNLGTFFISAGSEGFDSPEKCTPHHVKAQRVCFKADPCLRKSLKLMKFSRKN